MNKKNGRVVVGVSIVIMFMLVFYWLQSSSIINSSLIVANDKADLEAGAIRVSKTAKKVDGMVNQWDITVLVEGKEQFPPPATDIVLILDKSNSMNQNSDDTQTNSRMDKAKEAAKNFVNDVLKDGYNNKLAFISYGEEITIHSYSSGTFANSSNRKNLNDTIDQLQANGGGTYTQKALSAAASLMGSSTAKRRYIILISDGVPTFSNQPTSTYTDLSNMEQIEINGKIEYQTVKTIPKTGFRDIKVGNGSSYRSSGVTTQDGKKWYYNHANSAIAQASIIKTEQLNGEPLINDLYTVGVDLDSDSQDDEIRVGNQTMKEIASSEKKCFSVNSTELTNILDGIAGEIIGALKDALVVDPMGKGFVLDGDIEETQGTATIRDDDTIYWVMGALIGEDLEKYPSGDVKYAEMTYRVSATNEVLADGVIDANGLAKTNGTTSIQYIDYKNETQSKNIEVPLVEPIIAMLQKKLVGTNEEEIQSKDISFNFDIGNDKYTQNDSFTLYPGESIQWVHPWKAGSKYTIKENISEEEYEVKTNINGKTFESSTAAFEFQLINGEYEHKKIVVQNKKLPSFKIAWLNIRQSVVNSHEDLVIPSKGYYKMLNVGTSGQESGLISGSTTFDSPDKVTQTLFTRYQYNLNKENLNVTINDLIPEYYTIFGHIVTPTDNNLGTTHLSTNQNDLILTNEVSLDYQTEDEYWVTVFITPQFGSDSNGTKEESPRPYSWSYKTNRFSD